MTLRSRPLRRRSRSARRDRSIPTRLLVIPVVLFPLLLIAAACGSAEKVQSAPTTEPSGAGPGGSTTAPHPTPGAGLPGKDEVAFRVVSCCGFVPAETAYGYVPDLSIMGDGRAIVSGPTTMQYPGKALPNLLQGKVSDDVVAALGRRAESTGLLEANLDFGQPMITDMATTTVTIWAEGKVHTIEVYALESESEQMTAEQKANRKAVRDLVDAASTATRGVEQAYVAARVTVHSLPVAEPSDDGTGITPGKADWPLDDPARWPKAADQGTPCHTYDGAEAKAVLDAAATASQITRWVTADGEQRHLVFRPLLPDELDLCR